MYTFGSSLLALQVQDAAPPAGSGGMLQILADASPLSQIVLAILIVFSVASWAIILFKTLSYRAVARQTATFLDVFRRSQKFSDVQAICPSLPSSPLVGVFQAGYAEITAQFRLTGQATGSPGTAPSRPAPSRRQVVTTREV